MKLPYGSMDYELAHEFLTITKKIFDEAGIPYFLIFGTLLGAMREKDFIDHDDHVDIGIFGKDADRVLALKPKFEEAGYHLAVGAKLQSSGRFMSFLVIKEGTEIMKVDIYTFFLFRGVRWFVRYFAKGQDGYPSEYGVPFHNRFFKSLSHINFRGAKHNIPSESIDLLSYLWGEIGWRIPSRGQVGNKPLGVWFKMGELEDEENPNV